MTEPRPAPSTQDVRRLVTRARAAVAAAQDLPAQASSGTDRDWAEQRARALAGRWQNLLEVLRAPKPRQFIPVLDAISSNVVPLEDASEAMRPAADAVIDLLDALAADVTATTRPLDDAGADVLARELLTVAATLD